ncbi:hypothetical protein RF55_16507 [Lasius niger]|uniref:Uncharacterized protein n=1 Tax=Lasius niger TaxID=67767 RepID=A0A0J7K4B4_LASNI|nr:hypothetical protein RF55_16507 [Lasius niger]
MNRREKIRKRVQKHRLIKSALNSILQSDDSYVGNLDQISNIASTSRIYRDSSTVNDSIHIDAIPLQLINEDENEDENENDNEDENQHHNFSESSEDDNSNMAENDSEIEEIRNWAITYNIPLAHIDVLLNILRKRLLPQLPKCSKTFLESSKAEYTVKAMRGANDHIGEFVYLGIEKGLKNCVDPNAHRDNIISLQMNVDGASPYKSSTKQLWPILCKILHEPDIYFPFPVAIYYGDSKPSDTNYSENSNKKNITLAIHHYYGYNHQSI